MCKLSDEIVFIIPFLLQLEGQTKQKKVKKDDLQARLQAGWEAERGEHRRLVSEANHNSLETQRQMDVIRNKKQREVEAMKDNFEKERADWRNEKTKINEHMHKVGLMVLIQLVFMSRNCLLLPFHNAMINDCDLYNPVLKIIVGCIRHINCNSWDHTGKGSLTSQSL